MISRDFEKLINSFTKIPTVGLKTAERYAYSIINMSKEDAENLAKNILDVKNKVHLCKVCGNFTTEEVCDICSSRSSEIISLTLASLIRFKSELIFNLSGVIFFIGLSVPFKIW